MNYLPENAMSKDRPFDAIDDSLGKLNALLQLCFDQVAGEVTDPDMGAISYALMLAMEQADRIEGAAERLHTPMPAHADLIKVA